MQFCFNKQKETLGTVWKEHRSMLLHHFSSSQQVVFKSPRFQLAVKLITPISWKFSNSKFSFPPNISFCCHLRFIYPIFYNQLQLRSLWYQSQCMNMSTAVNKQYKPFNISFDTSCLSACLLWVCKTKSSYKTLIKHMTGSTRMSSNNAALVASRTTTSKGEWLRLHTCYMPKYDTLQHPIDTSTTLSMINAILSRWDGVEGLDLLQ